MQSEEVNVDKTTMDMDIAANSEMDNDMDDEGGLVREREPDADLPYYEDEDFVTVFPYEGGSYRILRATFEDRMTRFHASRGDLFGSGLSPAEKAAIRAEHPEENEEEEWEDEEEEA